MILPIVGHGVARQQSLHKGSQRDTPRPDEEMDMIRHQNPREAGRLSLQKKGTQAIKEGLAVRIVLEDSFPFNPPGHQMVKAPGKVYPCLPGHNPNPSNLEHCVILFAYGRPQISLQRPASAAPRLRRVRLDAIVG